MHEILFRGKSIHGEWIYGYLNQHRGNIRYDCDCEPIADGCYYINDWQARIDTGMYGQDYKVDPSAIGQFTGLCDKNGVKIFEGDILDFFSDDNLREPDEHSYYAVRWRGAGLLVMDEHGCTDCLDEFFCQRCEVVGNIHDNPELLEVSGDEP